MAKYLVEYKGTFFRAWIQASDIDFSLRYQKPEESVGWNYIKDNKYELHTHTTRTYTTPKKCFGKSWSNFYNLLLA